MGGHFTNAGNAIPPWISAAARLAAASFSTECGGLHDRRGVAGSQSLTLDPGGAIAVTGAGTTSQTINANITLGSSAGTRLYLYQQQRHQRSIAKDQRGREQHHDRDENVTVTAPGTRPSAAALAMAAEAGKRWLTRPATAR